MEILAFYLPQYHPIPINDAWWGPGFTEWSNVAKARPLFRGHDQPHLPADLGFYDLRVPEVRARQAELARSHGVTGFIYWHYWFAGQRLLERPLDEVIATREPDFPFCVAWANHSWSDTWMGGPNRVMVEQTYPGPEDDQAHFDDLRIAFEDPRYLQIGGKPILFVFRPDLLPNAKRFVETWQRMAHDFGGLYLVACGPFIEPEVMVDAGFDAIAFIRKPFDTAALSSRLASLMRRNHLRRGPHRFRFADFCTSEPPAQLDCTAIPCVWPNWDDTPRRGRRGVVAVGSSPERFERQVPGALDIARRAPHGEQMVVIKSWNEWAEGNYIEPDQEFGLGWLEALARGLATRGEGAWPARTPS
jgi:lipopolysaccharide biosynthesis protein